MDTSREGLPGEVEAKIYNPFNPALSLLNFISSLSFFLNHSTQQITSQLQEQQQRHIRVKQNKKKT